MTPADLAGLRAQDAAAWRHRDILALCDALEAAWAERDHMLPETEIRPVLECENLKVLRSAIIGIKRGQIHLRERADKAEAALARVHDELDRANELRMFDDVFKRIRAAAAIEGDNQ